MILHYQPQYAIDSEQKIIAMEALIRMVDGNGNLIQLYEDGTGVSPQTTNYTYDTDGIRLKTVTNPLGHETENFYSASGRLFKQEDYLNKNINLHYVPMFVINQVKHQKVKYSI